MPRAANFYHDLACRYGFGAEAERIQDLYLGGRKDEAAAAVPDDLVRESGATTLNITPLAGTAAQRVHLIERITELAGDL